MSKPELDWQWLSDLLDQFDITDKRRLTKNARDFTSLKGRLYTEIQSRYTPRKKPHYISPVDGVHTSEEAEQAKRIHADQIATMHKMGYGLLLDGFTFYKYGRETEPFNYETNFNMHQAYEIHRLITAKDAELAEAVAQAKLDSALVELKYLDEIFAEYDSKRKVWSVIQSHICNRKAQLAQPPRRSQPSGQKGGGRD